MKKILVVVTLAFVALPALGDGPKLPPDPVYRAECGSCHVAFPPRLLPHSAWHQLMMGLEKHFGSDASLDAATSRHVAAYLAVHAGRRAPPPGPEPRITQTPWFLKEHRNEIPPRSNPADCAACHKRAEQGFYDEP